ncbi:MAG: beta strand repeat-containing protein [Gemmataceae bacterium]
MRMMLRMALGLWATMMLSTMATAQTWSTQTTGNWNVPGNWTPSGVPTSGATTQLNFNATGTASYTATNDIGAFTLNRITVNNTGTGTVTLAGSGLITPAGTDPTLDITGNTLFTGLFAGSPIITKTGPGTLTHNSNNGGFTGQLIINQGTFLNTDSGNTSTNFNPTLITVNNGGTYQFGLNTVGNPNLPDTTYITINAGGTVIYQEGEQQGGINLQGGTLDLQQGGITSVTNGSSPNVNAWTSGTLTGTTTTARTLSSAFPTNKTTAGTVTITGNASLVGAGVLNIQEGTILASTANNLGTSPLSFGAAATQGTFQYSGATASRGGAIATTGLGGNIQVNTAATVLTLSGAVTGAGPINKTGPGTLALTGALTGTGTTTATEGILLVNPVTASGNFAIASSGTLAVNSGTGATPFTTPGLNFASSTSALRFNLNTGSVPTGPLVTVSGTDTLTGGGILRLTNAQAYANGTYTLIDYTGAAITTGFTIDPIPGRTSVALVYNNANTSIDASIASDSIKWGGQINNTWDTGTAINIGGTNNFRLVSNNADTNFVLADTPLFDDTASSFTINIPGTVLPSNVTFNNSTAYTVTGAGKISGTTPLSKLGTGNVNLATDNDYTGGTNIAAGTLTLGNGGTTGSVTGGITGTAAGATLAFNRSDNLSFGNVLTGSLNLTKTGTNTVTLTASNSQTGTVLLQQGVLSIGSIANLGNVASTVSFDGGTLRITANYDTAGSATSQVFNLISTGTVDVPAGLSLIKRGEGLQGAGTITKIGAGTFGLGSGGTSTAGNIDIQEGTFRLTSPRTNSVGGLTIANGARLYILDTTTFTNSAPLRMAIGVPINFGGGASPDAPIFQHDLDEAGSAAATTDAPLNLNSTTRFIINTRGADANVHTLGNTVSGAGGLIKEGLGSLVLFNSTTYSGNTTVNAGTLRLTLFATNPSPVTTVASGATYDLSLLSAYTLGGTQTLQGAGTVIAPGSSAIQVDGTLRAGSSTTTETLTLGNSTITANGTIATTIGADGSSGVLAMGTNTLNLTTGTDLALTGLVSFPAGSAATYPVATFGSTLGETNLQLDSTAVANGFVFGTFVQGTGATGPVTIDVSSFGIALADGDSFSLVRNGDVLQLVYAPVPEPMTIGLVCMAGAAVLVRRRRNRQVI